MKTHEIRVYIIKWGIELGYIKLEDLDINRLADLVSRGYSIKPVSMMVNYV